MKKFFYNYLLTVKKINYYHTKSIFFFYFFNIKKYTLKFNKFIKFNNFIFDILFLVSFISIILYLYIYITIFFLYFVFKWNKSLTKLI